MQMPIRAANRQQKWLLSQVPAQVMPAFITSSCFRVGVSSALAGRLNHCCSLKGCTGTDTQLLTAALPPAERVFLSGSASVVTTNASLAIEGAAGPVVIANAGICNLHLPSDDAWIPVQPCLITGQPPPTEAGDGASLVAQQAGAFNQTCRFNRDENSESSAEVVSI